MKSEGDLKSQALTNTTGRNMERAAGNDGIDLNSVWDQLPAAVRAGIQAMIRASTSEGSETK